MWWTAPTDPSDHDGPHHEQAEEIVNPHKTAITRARGPVFQFMTEGSLQNTTGSRANRVKLASTKKGIENFISGSLVEVRPMSVDKLQGLRCKVATVDEWLSSADAREDVIGAIEQGASKLDDYLIIATSSEGTVRNGAGDTIKMELMNILQGIGPPRSTCPSGGTSWTPWKRSPIRTCGSRQTPIWERP